MLVIPLYQSVSGLIFIIKLTEHEIIIGGSYGNRKLHYMVRGERPGAKRRIFIFRVEL